MSDSSRPTPDSGVSVTIWIEQLKQGQNEAARLLWDRYFQRLVNVARRRLATAPRRVSDEEDVAVNVFNSLCVGAAAGRFDRLTDRDDLWKLLVTISRMKSADQVRHQTAKKRGGTDVRGHSVFGVENEGFERFLADEIPPEFIVSMDEQQAVLFGLLTDESQRTVATLRMEGHSNEDIAENVGISLRSVERKLKIIRETWKNYLDQAAD